MNNQGQKIELIYERDTLENTDILELQKELTERNIHFDSQQRSIMTCASIDFFMPVIQFVTSESFLFGFTASAAWDLFKTITRFAYNKFHNHKTHKRYNGKTVDTPTNIHFDIGNTHLVLPVDTDKATCSGVRTERIATATFAPTPLIVVRSLKQLSSLVSANPQSSTESSRTIIWV